MEEQPTKGHLHPISIVIRDAHRIFRDLGFSFVSGPEIESEYYNFEALNIPEHHPARDMWDTLWVDPKTFAGRGERPLLRTHTSPVQVRYMEEHDPPFRIIAPGKVFRFEATDATHEAQFFHLEGLLVEHGASLVSLKGTVDTFLNRFFRHSVETRFRPGYFPFVEPGIEVDMSCFNCDMAGCRICKQTGWIEIMGAGMVHPHVLASGNISSQEWRGFAFGMGLDRLAMLRYGINDVRLLYNGDLRVVNQF